MKEPKKVKEVSFYPSLDMETRSRETQYAVATVHSKMTPRLDGKRQCKGTERLGDFFSGKKTLATSQDKVDIINDINPIFNPAENTMLSAAAELRLRATILRKDKGMHSL
jgi:hypothetical protein